MMLAVARCFVCGSTFTFNPYLVPSARDEYGVRQPVCEECMHVANAERVSKGLAPHAIPRGAYDPVEDSELS